MEEATSNIIYFTTCPGGSNVSILAYRAITTLEKNGHGKFIRLAGERGKEKDLERLTEAKNTAQKWLLVDGCDKVCGLKILENAGIKPDQYLRISSLGIARENSTDYTPDELDKVVTAIMELIY